MWNWLNALSIGRRYNGLNVCLVVYIIEFIQHSIEYVWFSFRLDFNTSGRCFLALLTRIERNALTDIHVVNNRSIQISNWKFFSSVFVVCYAIFLNAPFYLNNNFVSQPGQRIRLQEYFCPLTLVILCSKRLENITSTLGK